MSQDSQGASGTVTVVTGYGYDALNRLTGVTTHPSVGTNLTTAYVLDGSGNATMRTAGDNVSTWVGIELHPTRTTEVGRC